MSQGKWVRRKPGSIGDTVVPASAYDDVAPPAPPMPPPLPKRRPGEHRRSRSREHQPVENQPATARPVQARPAQASPLPRRRPGEHRSGQRTANRDNAGPPAWRSQPEPPSLPDNVRSLFRPVLIAPAPGRSAAGTDAQVLSLPTRLAGGHGGLRSVPRAVPRAEPRATRADPRSRYDHQVVWLVALTVLALLTAVGTIISLVQLHHK